MRPTLPGFESPSLLPREGGALPAFELKFLLDERMAAAVESWARDRMMPDPHGNPALGGGYHTTSIYCDTPALDVFYRGDGHRRRKFRVRRYGEAPWVYLERKSKSGDRVAKRRSAVTCEELPLLDDATAEPSWTGQWFHERVRQRSLRPAALITYLRKAHVGTCAEGPLRLTLDRNIRGSLTGAWTLQSAGQDLPLLPDQVILEMKFCSALPAPFKALVHDLQLSPGGVSKYRLCREAWGLTPKRSESADA